jgi:hypothetical protein
MNAVYGRILKELGPDALRVYRAMEALADENGRLIYDPKRIAEQVKVMARKEARQ